MKISPIFYNGIRFLKYNPTFWIFPILSLLINISIFYLFIFLTESMYGVDIFRPTALEEWFSLEFWGKLHHVGLAIFILYFYYITITFSASVAVKALCLDMSDNKFKFWELVKLAVKRTQTISKFAFIRELNLFIGMFELLDIPEQLKKIKSKVIGYKPSKTEDTLTPTMPIMPSIMSNSENLKFNAEAAKQLMSDHFKGKKFIDTDGVINIVLVAIFLISAITLGYTISPIAAIIVSTTLFFTFAHILKYPQLIFTAALYNYVTNKPTGNVYTAEFIESRFN